MKKIFKVTMGVFLCVYLLGHASIFGTKHFIAEGAGHDDSLILPGIKTGDHVPGPCIEDPQGYEVECDENAKGWIEVLNKNERKYLLHLEGNHYQMGYQHGYLLAPVIETSVNEATTNMLELFFNGEVDLPPVFGNFAWRVFLPYINAIPLRYQYEIWGMVDGIFDAKYSKHFVNDKESDSDDIKKLKNRIFASILKLNLGPDIANSYYNQTEFNKSDYQAGPNYLLKGELEAPHSCDGFVVRNRDKDGQVKNIIMGRNFMYLAEPLWKYGIVIEYYPSKTYKRTGYGVEQITEIPHVNVAMAGSVGVVTGMNSEGIGIGMNLTHTLDSDFVNVGMGAGIAARIAIAEHKNLGTAFMSIANTYLGAPWVFTIADGKNPFGAIVLEKAKGHAISRSLMDTFDYLTQVDVEGDGDFIATSNFFLAKEMYEYNCKNWWGLNVPVKAGIIGYDRYNEILRRLTEADNGGGLCFENIAKIGNECNICSGLDKEECEFQTRNGAGLVNYLRDWDDNPEVDQPYSQRELIATSVTLMDLTARKMKTKYSKYEHDWVNYHFD